ncbi:MAG: hypothetical protein KatS3mg027_2364 [Bacteroidia bacterium]|nr:MAG: hypothetical protein KatS3mg027_2364 [Bacteroidia bacterium]
MRRTKINFHFIIFLITRTCLLYCQNPPEKYLFHINKADSLFQQSYYNIAKVEYLRASSEWGNTGLPFHQYQLARCYAELNNRDSAFMYLNNLMRYLAFSNPDTIQNDKHFINLYNDKRWIQFINKVKTIEQSEKSGVIKSINTMVQHDQFWRRLMVRHINNDNNVKDSITEPEIKRKIQQTDSVNYFSLKKILKKVGFPGYSKVGMVGSQNFWILVQHQDKHINFQKKVLKKMKKEVKRNNASPNLYAYLYDRVMVNTGKKQMYGTQMRLNKDSTSYEPYPLKYPDKVNELRREVGLPPIEEYIKQMNQIYYGKVKK